MKRALAAAARTPWRWRRALIFRRSWYATTRRRRCPGGMGRRRQPGDEADQAAERVILAGLTTWASPCPVRSREEAAGGRRACRRSAAGRSLLVRPARRHGGNSFSRNGEFTVDIAVIEDGAPGRLGLVHAPALGETYGGLAGDGAWRRRGPTARRRRSAPAAFALRGRGGGGQPRPRRSGEDRGVPDGPSGCRAEDDRQLAQVLSAGGRRGRPLPQFLRPHHGMGTPPATPCSPPPAAGSRRSTARP